MPVPIASCRITMAELYWKALKEEFK